MRIQRQGICTLIVLAGVIFVSQNTASAEPLGDLFESTLYAPVKTIEHLQHPKETPAYRKILNGTATVLLSPFAPALGALYLTSFKAFGKPDCRLSPSETLGYGTAGALSGAGLAPVSTVAGTSEVLLGVSGLPFEAVRHFSELQRDDLPTEQTESLQPTAELLTTENGQMGTVDIPLELNPYPFQLNQKLKTEPNETIPEL